MSLQKKAVKGIVWSFLEKWSSQVVSTSVFLVLARLLGPEAFGLIALASVFTAFMAPFLNQGFAQAIIQREELEKDHLDSAFWMSVSISLFMIALTVSSAGLVANFFGEPKLQVILPWLSINFFFTALQSIQTAILRRKFAFKTLAVRSSLANLVSGIVGVGMAFQGFGVWSLVGQQLVNGLVGTIVLWTASEWSPRFRISRQHLGDLFSFGSNVTGIYVLRFFNRRSDDFLIGYFLGSVALGYYTVAYRLLLVMINLFTTTMSQVSLPTFSRLQEDLPKMRKGFYTVTQLTSLVAFPAFLAVVALAPELVTVLFGEEWVPSIAVMQVLSIGGILQCVSYFNGTVIMAMGKPSWKLKINSLNVVINVIGFLIAVRWGILAVAIAFVISNYLFSPISLLAVRRLIKINIMTYFNQYLISITGSAMMVLAMVLTKFWLSNNTSANLQVQLIMALLIGGLTYILSLLMLAPSLVQKTVNLVQMVLSKKVG